MVEQNCAYQDVDKNDLLARHLLLWEKNQLIAYARILPPNNNQKIPRIGRVVVHPNWRRKGFGEEIMKLAINDCQLIYPGLPIKISAQSYLKSFYEKFGFSAEGEEYLEDNIPHIAMNLNFTLSQTN